MLNFEDLWSSKQTDVSCSQLLEHVLSMEPVDRKNFITTTLQSLHVISVSNTSNIILNNLDAFLKFSLSTYPELIPIFVCLLQSNPSKSENFSNLVLFLLNHNITNLYSFLPLLSMFKVKTLQNILTVIMSATDDVSMSSSIISFSKIIGVEIFQQIFSSSHLLFICSKFLPAGSNHFKVLMVHLSFLLKSNPFDWLISSLVLNSLGVKTDVISNFELNFITLIQSSFKDIGFVYSHNFNEIFVYNQILLSLKKSISTESFKLIRLLPPIVRFLVTSSLSFFSEFSDSINSLWNSFDSCVLPQRIVFSVFLSLVKFNSSTAELAMNNLPKFFTDSDSVAGLISIFNKPQIKSLLPIRTVVSSFIGKFSPKFSALVPLDLCFQLLNDFNSNQDKELFLVILQNLQQRIQFSMLMVSVFDEFLKSFNLFASLDQSVLIAVLNVIDLMIDYDYLSPISAYNNLLPVFKQIKSNINQLCPKFLSTVLRVLFQIFIQGAAISSDILLFFWSLLPINSEFPINSNEILLISMTCNVLSEVDCNIRNLLFNVESSELPPSVIDFYSKSIKFDWNFLLSQLNFEYDFLPKKFTSPFSSNQMTLPSWLNKAFNDLVKKSHSSQQVSLFSLGLLSFCSDTTELSSLLPFSASDFSNILLNFPAINEDYFLLSPLFYSLLINLKKPLNNFLGSASFSVGSKLRELVNFQKNSTKIFGTVASVVFPIDQLPCHFDLYSDLFSNFFSCSLYLDLLNNYFEKFSTEISYRYLLVSLLEFLLNSGSNLFYDLNVISRINYSVDFYLNHTNISGLDILIFSKLLIICFTVFNFIEAVELSRNVIKHFSNISLVSTVSIIFLVNSELDFDLSIARDWFNNYHQNFETYFDSFETFSEFQIFHSIFDLYSASLLLAFVFKPLKTVTSSDLNFTSKLMLFLNKVSSSQSNSLIFGTYLSLSLLLGGPVLLFSPSFKYFSMTSPLVTPEPFLKQLINQIDQSNFGAIVLGILFSHYIFQTCAISSVSFSDLPRHTVSFSYFNYLLSKPNENFENHLKLLSNVHLLTVPYYDLLNSLIINNNDVLIHLELISLICLILKSKRATDSHKIVLLLNKLLSNSKLFASKEATSILLQNFDCFHDFLSDSNLEKLLSNISTYSIGFVSVTSLELFSKAFINYNNPRVYNCFSQTLLFLQSKLTYEESQCFFLFQSFLIDHPIIINSLFKQIQSETISFHNIIVCSCCLTDSSLQLPQLFRLILSLECPGCGCLHCLCIDEYYFIISRALVQFTNFFDIIYYFFEVSVFFPPSCPRFSVLLSSLLQIYTEIDNNILFLFLYKRLEELSVQQLNSFKKMLGIVSKTTCCGTYLADKLILCLNN
ncbi:hypothetical protein RCL1_006557 [Eukaryota sp. TZLM3-RCL]